MNKFYGKVGYAITGEDPNRPGVWVDTIVEKYLYGDIQEISSRWQSSQQSTNDDLVLNEAISLVADEFANQHAFSIKYVERLGTLWKVTSIKVQSPRILVTLGGVYNG